MLIFLYELQVQHLLLAFLLLGASLDFVIFFLPLVFVISSKPVDVDKTLIDRIETVLDLGAHLLHIHKVLLRELHIILCPCIKIRRLSNEHVT